MAKENAEADENKSVDDLRKENAVTQKENAELHERINKLEKLVRAMTASNPSRRAIGST